MLQPARLTKAAARKAPIARPVTIMPPVEGWDASSALASMGPKRAVTLRNWFPQPGWIEVRKGYKYHAWDIVSDTTSVESLMVWQGPSSSKMFAAGSTAIYDVTSNAAAASAVTSLSNARWQHVMQTTSAGAYLVIANGVDSIRHYNGSAWATPSITGVASTDIIHLCVHKKRLWMVQVNTTNAWYLATEAVAGAATKFSVGANFTRGGYLLAMASWTRDGGAGADDFAVFISSEGQAAVYQGTDPATADTWGLVGVFDVPKPIGRRCFRKFGGDLLLLTVEGVYPFSQLFAVDQSQAKRVSITANIATKFNEQAQSYQSNFGWDLVTYPSGTRLIVNIPTAENDTATQYVMNTLTGAWCEYDAHNANCWAEYNGRIYFGGNDGSVYRADTGRADVDQPITAIGETSYQPFGTGSLKRFLMLKPLVTATGSNRPSLGISIDFTSTDYLSTTVATQTAVAATWDSAVWDTSSWGGTTETVQDWTNVVGVGTFGSVKFRAQTGISVGSSAWGVSLWGSSRWGSEGISNEDMKINGFLALVEQGGMI